MVFENGTRKLKAKKLSKLVSKSLKKSEIKLQNLRLWPRLKYLIQQSIASAYSFIIIVLVYSVFFLPLGINPNLVSDKAIGNLESLWTVQIGILTITVTVVVFIIQSINSRYTRQNIFRIFVKESYIFPIIYLNLTNIAGISWLLFYFDPSEQTGLIHLVYIVFLICILVIGRLYVTVFKFLNPSYVQEERIKELRKTFDMYLVEELKAKVGEVMLNKLCHQSEIAYLPLRIEYKNAIRSKKEGKIIDINFVKIENILRRIEKTEESYTSNKPVKAFILKSTGNSVSRENAILLDVPDESLSEKEKQKLATAFKVREVILNEELLHQKLNELRDETDLAIRDLSIEGIRNLCQAYKVILTQFSNTILQYKNNYSHKVEPIFSLNEWENISEDLFFEFRYLISEGFSVERYNFVEPIISTAIEIMNIAIKNRDCITLKPLERTFITMYNFSNDIRNEKVRRFVQESSWRAPMQFCRDEILSPLNEEEAKFKNISFETAVCEQGIVLFLNIMKEAMDQNDKVTFEELGSALGDFASSHDFKSLRKYNSLKIKIRGPQSIPQTEFQVLKMSMRD